MPVYGQDVAGVGVPHPTKPPDSQQSARLNLTKEPDRLRGGHGPKSGWSQIDLPDAWPGPSGVSCWAGWMNLGATGLGGRKTF
jgi:hypothetical protein